MSAQVTRIKAANPDGIFVQGHENETSKIIRTLRQMIPGNYVLLGFDQMATTKHIELCGGCNNVKGTIYRTGILGERSSDASLQAFVKRWKAKYPNVDSFLPMVNYAGMQVLFEAVRLAGNNLSRENIRDSFYKIQGFNTLFGPVAVQKNGETMNVVHIMKFDDQCNFVVVKENY